MDDYHYKYTRINNLGGSFSSALCKSVAPLTNKDVEVGARRSLLPAHTISHEEFPFQCHRTNRV